MYGFARRRKIISLFYSCPLINKLISRLEQKFVDGSLDMELALKAFRKLKDEFSKEFQEFELQVSKTKKKYIKDNFRTDKIW